jgi:hypothetical protein
MTRTDRFGVEVRERTMWDIREGVVGSDTFIPKHVIIITWKNMSFAGGIDNSLFRVSEASTAHLTLSLTFLSLVFRPTRSKWCWQPMRSTLMLFSITLTLRGLRTQRPAVIRQVAREECPHMYDA